jgi:hypothetical protein
MLPRDSMSRYLKHTTALGGSLNGRSHLEGGSLGRKKTQIWPRSPKAAFSERAA